MHNATHRSILLAGALLAASGVAFGAFGAHALRDVLGPAEAGWWQTAVQYQMWHAIALVALAAIPAARLAAPAALLGAGTLVFSGSLYLMALTGARQLGMVTPVGGLLMIIGWLLLAWRAARPAASET
jgi:uncharacterized membrane protein YgdD (TMEM256/DUF423 family)